jgi:hypothetical protein
MAAKCTTCNNEPQLTAENFAPEPAARQPLLLRGASNPCSDAIVSNTLLADPGYFARHRCSLGVAIAGASALGAVHKVHGAQESTAVSTNKLWENSPYQPLLVILKI